MYDLVIIIPCYNEEGCISSVLESWDKTFFSLNITFQILVINDGSKDRSAEIVAELSKKNSRIQLINKKNGGHGSAVMHGYQLALKMDTKWIFQVDSDNQFMPVDFIKLWSVRDKYPAIHGQRLNRHDPLHRKIISKILRIVLVTIFQRYITDPNIPYRLYRKDVFEQMLPLIPTDIFAPNIFLSILAHRRKLLGPSIPITHIERQTGKVSIIGINLLKSCFRSFKELIKFRLSI